MSELNKDKNYFCCTDTSVFLSQECKVVLLNPMVDEIQVLSLFFHVETSLFPS